MDTTHTLSQFVKALVTEVTAQVIAASPGNKKPEPSGWMNTPEAAKYLGLKPNTLEILRCKGLGPKYAKPSRNIVRYRASDLDDYLARQTFTHTAQDVPKRREKK
jgi:hypothetical protein